MKKIKLYSLAGMTMINLSKIKFLQPLLPEEKDIVRKLLLVSQYNLSTIEPYTLELDKENSEKFIEELRKRSSDYKDSFVRTQDSSKEYFPVFLDIPVLSVKRAIENRLNTLILKIYVNV